MLLFNLLDNSEKKSLADEVKAMSERGRAELKAVWFGLAGMILVLLGAWFGRDALYTLRLRAMHPEEREAIVSLIHRLQNEWPREDDSLDDFKSQFVGEQLKSYVDEYAGNPSIEVDGDRLIFSQSFFVLDWVSQSQILSKFLHGAEELPGLPPMDDLANRDE